MASLTGIPPSGRLAFKALRNKSPIGTHHLTFAREGDALTVNIAVDFLVKIGFIPVFRYKLRCVESWQGGVLISVRAKTDNNGTADWMRADLDGDALLVEGSKVEGSRAEGSKAARYRAPVGAIIASHWNQAQLDAPMINPQDGSLLRYAVAPRGPARIVDSTGKIRATHRFALTGANPLDLWYDADGLWTALQAKAADGSTIGYQLIG